MYVQKAHSALKRRRNHSLSKIRSVGWPNQLGRGHGDRSAAALLMARVHSKVVSERLGHSSIKVTLDIYSHVLPTMQREAAMKINEPLATSLSEDDTNN